MTAVLDGPSTIEGTVPGPAGQRPYYGFRLLQGADLDFMPVRLLDGSSPSPQDLTRVAADAAGDHLFGLTHLDLVDCRISSDAPSRQEPSSGGRREAPRPQREPCFESASAERVTTRHIAPGLAARPPVSRIHSGASRSPIRRGISRRGRGPRG